MRPPRSIFSQLLVLALWLIAPFVIFVIWDIAQQFQDDRRNALTHLGRLRQVAANQVSAYVEGTHRRLENLARRVDSSRGIPEEVTRLLREFGAFNPEFTNVMLVDGEGVVLASVLEPSEFSVSATGQFEPYRLAMTATDFRVSPVFKNPQGRWQGLLSQPVFDAPGRRTGTLLVPVNLILLSQVLAYDPTESDTVLSVLDERGVIALRSFRPENYLGLTSSRLKELLANADRPGGGSGELTSVDGTERTYSIARLGDTPWLVAVSTPTDRIYLDAWRNLWRATTMVTCVLALVIVLLLRRASVLAKPLTALAAAARAQAEGLTNATAPETGSKEIAQTARAFNEMVAQGRRTDQSLLESERRYRLIIEQTGQMVYELDVPTGRVTWFGSATIEKITGHSATELNESGIGGWKERVHPDDRVLAVANFEACLATGRPCHAEYRMRHKDGTYRFIEEQGVVLRDRTNAATQMLGCMSDITERRQVQFVLQSERALLRQIIDLVPHFIFAKATDGKFILANQTVAAAYGTDVQNLLGKTDADFSPAKKELEHFTADDLEVIQRGEPKVIPEETMTDATGRVRFLSTIKIPFVFDAGVTPAVLGVSIDITELKKAEQARQLIEKKLLETQKLESLGILAGGIAHDFNNLLTGILGNASLARMDLPRTSFLMPILEQIEMAAERAADLCKQMLAYSGKGRFVVQRLDLNQLVKDTTHLLTVSMNTSCLMRFDFAPNLPSIAADAPQIRQLITNLVINAAEAVGNRTGMITLSTRIVPASSEFLGTLLFPGEAIPGDYVLLEVSDNGSGMDASTLKKIFDPFFTTKFTGRGLGLAAVLGIVRGHKGALNVESDLGRGTTFKLLLPCAEGEADRPLSPSPLMGRPWRGQGTILVVDDEDAVRSISARILEATGFSVVEVSGGRAALDTYEREAGRFSLVLLDLTMPEMDGEQTFQQLRALNPALKVLLMSGFNQQDAVGRFTGQGLAGFVQKPFTAAKLIAVVRESLGGTIDSSN